MRSCKEIAKILASGNNLTFFQSLEAKMHLFMCGLCRKYEKHLKLLTYAQKKQVLKRESDSDRNCITMNTKNTIRTFPNQGY